MYLIVILIILIITEFSQCAKIPNHEHLAEQRRKADIRREVDSKKRNKIHRISPPFHRMNFHFIITQFAHATQQIICMFIEVAAI